MINIYNASLADILPQSLKIDSQFVAVAKALDPLLKKFAVDTKKAMHLPRLDELEGLILDVLADQFHVDNYDSALLTDEQKRNFIRNSIALHRLKGTVYAVEYVVNQFFADSEVEELDGFLFRIKAREYSAEPAAFETFCHMLFDAKPVRSWLVGIDLNISPPEQKVHVGNPIAVAGNLKFDILKPQPMKIAVKIGSPLVVAGRITIGG